MYFKVTMTADEIVRVETTVDPPGMEVIDRVEQLRYEIVTDRPISPESIPAEEFTFPVKTARRLEVQELHFRTKTGLYVRNEGGELLEEIMPLEEYTFTQDSYILEFETQIKTYVEVEGSFSITKSFLGTSITFDHPTTVAIGFRSLHTRPATTVTTTEEPVDVIAALDTFRSALKSTSPERSFPTLRGHPPRIEVGSSLDIPDDIEYLETGITIEVPTTYDGIYPAATLSYYLGAELVAGQTARIFTDTGFEYDLKYPHGYERTVERMLKQTLLLDCVTRTEGLYTVSLYERQQVDQRIDLDLASLYESDPATRLERYLSVDFETVKSLVQDWRLAVHVEPGPEALVQLPFVVDDLALIRMAPAGGETKTVAESTAHTDRSPQRPDPTGTTSDSTVLTRSSSAVDDPTTRSSAASPELNTFVQPDSAGAIEQAWIGDDIPIGASKLAVEAFEHRLNRTVSTDDIEIAIVLNDSRMDAERSLVDDAYGNREDLPFEITVDYDLTVDEFERRLAEDRDFLHYIGHIDDAGFECADGRFDAANLAETGVDAFLLNACRSYEQGRKLVKAGAIAAIVTLSEVVSDRAVSVGELLARLLNRGFPLRAALEITREETVLGGQYIVVGDGGLTLTQSHSRTPNLPEVTTSDTDPAVEIRTFATDQAGLGTWYLPYLGDNQRYFLTPGVLPALSASPADLAEFLALETVPTRLNGEFCWSNDVSLRDLSG